MKEFKKISFKEYTTLGIGGTSEKFVQCYTEDEVLEVYKYAKENQIKCFIFGGGSNLIVSDNGIDGIVLQICIGGIDYNKLDSKTFRVNVGAGVILDDFVLSTVEHDLSGVELLSGVPGWIGAAPVQNVGAYGAEVSQCIESVRCLDLETGKIVLIKNSDCDFRYRESIFNSSSKGRFWILSVFFILKINDRIKLSHRDLSSHIGREFAEHPSEIRNAIIAVREKKGMVDGGNQKSAGSFFKNPVVSKDHFEKILLSAGPEVKVPHYIVGEGESIQYKIPAAWLIGESGFPKGHTNGTVGISEMHNLCLINIGEATFKELISFADEIKEAVNNKFGISLKIEPEIVGNK